MKHNIKLGTKVSFKGDSNIYVVDSYQDLLGPCSEDCKDDHDHYEEPYITVRQQSWTAFPLSKLQYRFGKSSIGKKIDINKVIK